MIAGKIAFLDPRMSIFMSVSLDPKSGIRAIIDKRGAIEILSLSVEPIFRAAPQRAGERPKAALGGRQSNVIDL